MEYAVVEATTGAPLVGNIPLQTGEYKYGDLLANGDYFCDASQGSSQLFLVSEKGRVFATGENNYGKCVRSIVKLIF
jgi:alpha-tubulin suppressor-like RCC1 family protein